MDTAVGPICPEIEEWLCLQHISHSWRVCKHLGPARKRTVVVVVRPEAEWQVVAVLAHTHRLGYSVVLGGTEHTLERTVNKTTRCIVALHTVRLCSVLHVNPETLVARVQADCPGFVLEDALWQHRLHSVFASIGRRTVREWSAEKGSCNIIVSARIVHSTGAIVEVVPSRICTSRYGLTCMYTADPATSVVGVLVTLQVRVHWIAEYTGSSLWGALRFLFRGHRPQVPHHRVKQRGCSSVDSYHTPRCAEEVSNHHLIRTRLELQHTGVWVDGGEMPGVIPPIRAWHPPENSPLVDIAQSSAFELPGTRTHHPVHLWVRSGVHLLFYARGVAPSYLNLHSISLEPSARIHFIPGDVDMYKHILLQFNYSFLHYSTVPPLLSSASWIHGLPVRRQRGGGWYYLTGQQPDALHGLCAQLKQQIYSLQARIQSLTGGQKVVPCDIEHSTFEFVFDDLVNTAALDIYLSQGFEALEEYVNEHHTQDVTNNNKNE